MIGIYKFENLVNHKCYIGQSRDIKSRHKKHLQVMKNENDKNYNNHLYRSLRKYGIDNFNFEVIEECSIEELNKREEYWILTYDSFFNGYNSTFGGDGSGMEKNKGKVIQIIKDLEETSLTQSQIAKKNSLSEEMVQGINTGRYWRYEREYPIRKNPFEKQFKYCVDCGEEVYRTSIRCLDCERKNRIQEIPLSRDQLKIYLRTLTFEQIGSYFGVSGNAVVKWCKKVNLPHLKREIKTYSEDEWNSL